MCVIMKLYSAVVKNVFYETQRPTVFSQSVVNIFFLLCVSQVPCFNFCLYVCANVSAI